MSEASTVHVVQIRGRHHGDGEVRIGIRLMCPGHCMVKWACMYIASGGLRMRCVYLGCGGARTDKRHVTSW